MSAKVLLYLESHYLLSEQVFIILSIARGSRRFSSRVIISRVRRRKFRAASMHRPRCNSAVNIVSRGAKPVPSPPPRRVFRDKERQSAEKRVLGDAARRTRAWERSSVTKPWVDCAMFQGTGMEKENSASGGGGGGGGGGGAEAAAATPGATSTSEKLQADQANPLLDPTALFGGKSFSLVSLPPFPPPPYYFSLFRPFPPWNYVRGRATSR